MTDNKNENPNRKPTEEELAEIFTNAVNSYSFRNKKFTNKMLQQHRTLQQSFTGLCLDWLITLADVESYDLRNEASVKVAKKIKECLGEDGFYLPFI